MLTKKMPKPKVSNDFDTPTDLSPSEVGAVAKALNPMIADSFALYVKTKNFHWHVKGLQFRDLHLLFDEQAENILESIDILAERLRKIGAPTIKSLGHIVKLKTIPDDNDDNLSAVDMVQRLRDDNLKMVSDLREGIETCDDNRDSPTGNILQEILDQTEKRVWFLSKIIEN